MSKQITGKVIVSMPEGGKGTEVEVTVPTTAGERGLRERAKKQAGVDDSYEAKVTSWWPKQAR